MEGKGYGKVVKRKREIMEILTVHYNTPELMDAMIRSVRRFTDCTIHMFDNSDLKPFVNTFEGVKGKRYMFADKSCRYKPEMDLYLQTQCKANVISCSTFSWWGAFLNDHAEKVVCPWPWFSEGKIDPMEHILPDGWIKWYG